MNGRKAKALRRQAEAESVGFPPVRYTTKVLNPAKPSRTTMVLVGCTKAVYRDLKRA